MAQERRLTAAEVRVAVLDCAVLALASVLSYWLVTHGLARVHSVSRTDDTPNLGACPAGSRCRAAVA